MPHVLAPWPRLMHDLQRGKLGSCSRGGLQKEAKLCLFQHQAFLCSIAWPVVFRYWCGMPQVLAPWPHLMHHWQRSWAVAAEKERKKRLNYAYFSTSHFFVPLHGRPVVEALGALRPDACRAILPWPWQTHPLSYQYLLQCVSVSVVVQCVNAAVILGSAEDSAVVYTSNVVQLYFIISYCLI